MVQSGERSHHARITAGVITINIKLNIKFKTTTILVNTSLSSRAKQEPERTSPEIIKRCFF
jgi:hypothetical protein